ncbi:hypothetical protein BO79DRAFT_254466 [Aspergillus costaricaensis CBS 115574]|uniref:Uncharacterized protein n=1 Tax=Aspergillus costaricaensis CBS 115574 TaxID=1448317 RepID=A0ACD1IGL9_9EURO|nr:hypothetical protein BO79DRAFT_254466 [Aspergillus costaricaensis CBS 115574]RAK89711.1 hypothetical protein BO79DRAFT_254466 [Aspergillus costaricaensis CBS 115574]
MMRLSSKLVAATSLYLRKKSLKSCTLHSKWTTSSSNVTTKGHTMAVYHQQYCLVQRLNVLLCASPSSATAFVPATWIESNTACEYGRSVAEAISCDCKFDGLAMAWLPPHDSEEELA